MRVLMLNRADANTVPGGDTVQMLQTKKALEKLGVEVIAGSLTEGEDGRGFDIVHIFNWQQFGPIMQNLPSFLVQSQIVLSPIFWFHTGHWFEQARQKPAWKTIRHVLGDERARAVYEEWQLLKFRWGAEGRALRKQFAIPKQILPNSQIELEHLQSVLGMGGALRQRATVVPNGIERGSYDPLPPPDPEFAAAWNSRPFILEVARIQSAKNQLGLIEALFDLDVPILFIGQPSPYETDYVERCYQRGKERGNVHFCGSIEPERLPGIYRLAAVHALPSWRETPGLASLEAAAAGCRVVTTCLGSARNYFGEHAWYCDPRKPATIRQAVLDALKAQPSSELRDQVLSQFTWDIAAQKTLQAYSLALKQAIQ